MGSRSVTGSLVPRKDSPGTDIFRNDNGDCIVRSDLGCYLQTELLENGRNIKIQRLHPACRGGDHYMGCVGDPDIYILKGGSYRVVKDLSMDEKPLVFDLHPRCRSGDHYGKTGSQFFIIFQNQGEMRWVTDLRTAEGERNFVLHSECTKGLYYFGIGYFLTLIQVDEKWGAQFYLYNEMSSASLNSVYSIHPDVLNFFPGGVTLTEGIFSAGWECIKILYNDSDSPITWSDKVTHKVGFAKEKMSSIEHNWSISAEMSIKAGKLIELITKFQFSLKAEYSGRSIRTEQEDWNEAREEEESIQVTLEPQKNLYIWQYQLGIGQEPVLFCRDIQFTKENNPPDRIPLSLVA
ncbi:uncharacterized protein LOC117885702 [Trachemys scripta elegans]|uniref:uncharacterized protein LOC117885702 n=1 Tax=Trachemys scripta elegans TaxID=31138 RepID=UPI0015516DC0|nr:uncharacterized protein LOC117885702 [Trachemys scripta elegans]